MARRMIDYVKAMILLHTEDIYNALMPKIKRCEKMGTYYTDGVYNSTMVKIREPYPDEISNREYVVYTYRDYININWGDFAPLKLINIGDGFRTITGDDLKNIEYNYLKIVSKYTLKIDIRPLESLVTFVEELLDTKLEWIILDTKDIDAEPETIVDFSGTPEFNFVKFLYSMESGEIISKYLDRRNRDLHIKLRKLEKTEKGGVEFGFRRDAVRYILLNGAYKYITPLPNKPPSSNIINQFIINLTDDQLKDLMSLRHRILRWATSQKIKLDI